MAARVEVVRSSRRRKSVHAREVNGVIQVSIPAWMSKADEQQWVDRMVKRIERRKTSDEIDLPARAELLAVRHGLPLPSSIRWVSNQEWRWGSCTPADGTIRLSTRLAGFPQWVIDYVIVHELAHLVELHHNDAFHALVDRYPRAERARGFLIAKSMGEDESEPSEKAARPVRPAAEPRSPLRGGQSTLF